MCQIWVISALLLGIHIVLVLSILSIIDFLYTQLLLHFKLKFQKTLHACLLWYGDLHIVTAFWLDQFLRSYSTFWLRISHKKDYKIHSFNHTRYVKIKCWCDVFVLILGWQFFGDCCEGKRRRTVKENFAGIKWYENKIPWKIWPRSWNDSRQGKCVVDRMYTDCTEIVLRLYKY